MEPAVTINRDRDGPPAVGLLQHPDRLDLRQRGPATVGVREGQALKFSSQGLVHGGSFQILFLTRS